MMKSSDRIDKIAKYVANHFTENVEPMGFKAFLVGVDREACALYKEALDAYLPPDYSQVVFSPSHNDSTQLKRHHLTEDDEKAVRKAFIKKEQNPKILIVTEKLLTGFDAPILYCMYLDKPLLVLIGHTKMRVGLLSHSALCWTSLASLKCSRRRLHLIPTSLHPLFRTSTCSSSFSRNL
jgi:hypothetical protein